MKKAAKLLSILLAVTMLIGIIPMSASAVKIYTTEDIVTSDPNGVNFDIPLEVGKLYKGGLQGDESYATAEFFGSTKWTGYAKGFYVDLTENDNYVVSVYLEGDNAAYVDLAIAVYYDGELGYYNCDWAQDSYMELKLGFPFYQPGEYQILVLANCRNEDDNDLFDYTYLSVVINDSMSMIDYSTVIDPDSQKEITFAEDDIYVENELSYGSAFGFNTNLTAGKNYEIKVRAERNEDIISHDLSFGLTLMEHKDGELLNSRVSYDYVNSYVFTPDTTGNYEFLFLGGTWDSTDGQYLYDDNVYYYISVTEIYTFTFDIFDEEDYIEFVDDLYYRSYQDYAVVANIYNDLDFDGNEYYHGIETNATMLTICGMGNINIEYISEPLITYANDVRIDSITVKGNLSANNPEGSVNSIGLLIDNAYNAVIKNCGAVGNISITANEVYEIGGLAGYVRYLTVEDTDVAVDISITNTDSASYIGGVCGYSDTVYASNVTFAGDIDLDVQETVYCVGGFAGEIYNGSVFENCTVTGDINYTGAAVNYVSDIGGFVGYAEDYNTFVNCSVTGNVYTVYGGSVGGFAGYIDEANEFYNCFADGHVSGKNYVGGFLGISECCGGNLIENCYSKGNVNAANYLGGFVGIAYNDDTFVNCYTNAKLYCSETVTEETYLGTFAGFLAGSDITFHNIYAKQSVNYSTIGFDDYGNDTSSVMPLDFSDSRIVNAIVGTLNSYVDETNEGEFSPYELLNWEVNTEDGTPKFAEKPQYLPGDANCDGEITSADYTLVKRACFNSYTLEGAAILAADVNGDGDITSADYSLIKRICFGTYNG